MILQEPRQILPAKILLLNSYQKSIQNDNILEIKVPTVAQESGDLGSRFYGINVCDTLMRST